MFFCFLDLFYWPQESNRPLEETFPIELEGPQEVPIIPPQPREDIGIIIPQVDIFISWLYKIFIIEVKEKHMDTFQLQLLFRVWAFDLHLWIDYAMEALKIFMDFLF